MMSFRSASRAANRILCVSQRTRLQHRPCSRHGPTVSSTAATCFTTGCIICAGAVANARSSPTCCSMEAVTPARRPKRRRPPAFGGSVPKLTSRGLATRGGGATTDVGNREDCPLCKKFGSGPCGEVFKEWLACTDDHPGEDAAGEPLHLGKCSDFAEKLAVCLDANEEYYTNDSNNNQEHRENDSGEKDEKLKVKWKDFVNAMEDGIASDKYNILPYPENINPKMEVRLATGTGAAFFNPEKDGRPIIAAYILDDNGDVIAAGSRDDMDMGDLGCVLQFKVANGIVSATGRAIYDAENDDISIFSRTVLIPQDK